MKALVISRVTAIIFAFLLFGMLIGFVGVTQSGILSYVKGTCGNGVCEEEFGETPSTCGDCFDRSEVFDVSFEHLVLYTSGEDSLWTFDNTELSDYITFSLGGLEECTDCTDCSDCRDVRFFKDAQNCIQCEPDDCDSSAGTCDFCESCESALSDYDSSQHFSCQEAFSCSDCSGFDSDYANCEECEIVEICDADFIDAQDCWGCWNEDCTSTGSCMVCDSCEKAYSSFDSTLFTDCGKGYSCTDCTDSIDDTKKCQKCEIVDTCDGGLTITAPDYDCSYCSSCDETTDVCTGCLDCFDTNIGVISEDLTGENYCEECASCDETTCVDSEPFLCQRIKDCIEEYVGIPCEIDPDLAIASSSLDDVSSELQLKLIETIKECRSEPLYRDLGSGEEQFLCNFDTSDWDTSYIDDREVPERHLSYVSSGSTDNNYYNVDDSTITKGTYALERVYSEPIWFGTPAGAHFKIAVGKVDFGDTPKYIDYLNKRGPVDSADWKGDIIGRGNEVACGARNDGDDDNQIDMLYFCNVNGIEVDYSSKEKKDSNTDGGSITGDSDQVVCGGENYKYANDQLDMLYFCRIKGATVDYANKREANSGVKGGSIIGAYNEVMCGGKNHKSDKTQIDKVYFCKLKFDNNANTYSDEKCHFNVFETMQTSPATVDDDKVQDVYVRVLETEFEETTLLMREDVGDWKLTLHPYRVADLNYEKTPEDIANAISAGIRDLDTLLKRSPEDKEQLCEIIYNDEDDIEDCVKEVDEIIVNPDMDWELVKLDQFQSDDCGSNIWFEYEKKNCNNDLIDGACVDSRSGEKNTAHPCWGWCDDHKYSVDSDKYIKNIEVTYQTGDSDSCKSETKFKIEKDGDWKEKGKTSSTGKTQKTYATSIDTSGATKFRVHDKDCYVDHSELCIQYSVLELDKVPNKKNIYYVPKQEGFKGNIQISVAFYFKIFEHSDGYKALVGIPQVIFR